MKRIPPTLGIILVLASLAGCGTVKEKTAPCKRPAILSSFVEDPRRPCGPMQSVNDPTAAFEAIGVTPNAPFDLTGTP
ncbi:hypothetical protein DEM27_24435 [Metarhizobium album]|uniref:Lipoprotein n=1 Tax=Metarhizobium album TaxID=2182425 RepID=A0A2U2DK95_9HYPH|nr:hypothetical protein [Rhizobium album]PWE53690.1 hypothetical protein DEM27_24435 [Rhizobium album]